MIEFVCRGVLQENIGTALQLSKSVDATRAVLQGQLRSKESENNRLCVQLRVRASRGRWYRRRARRPAYDKVLSG